MLNFSAVVSVHAPLEIVWELLVDKVEHPDRYVSGVQGLEILEKYADGVLRQLTHPVPIKERISIDREKLEVIFKLVDPILFSGYFFNHIHLPAATEANLPLKLEFGLEVEPTGASVAFDESRLPNAFFGALMHTKELAEQKAQAR
jgi:hypothetical protein